MNNIIIINFKIDIIVRLEIREVYVLKLLTISIAVYPD